MNSAGSVASTTSATRGGLSVRMVNPSIGNRSFTSRRLGRSCAAMILPLVTIGLAARVDRAPFEFLWVDDRELGLEFGPKLGDVWDVVMRAFELRDRLVEQLREQFGVDRRYRDSAHQLDVARLRFDLPGIE